MTPTPGKPVPVLCLYNVIEGKEEEFLRLLASHWPTLERAGLSTVEPAKVWKGFATRAKRTVFVELFSWKDKEAVATAHHTPELMQVWEPMGTLCGGDMEFIDVEAIEMPYDRT